MSFDSLFKRYEGLVVRADRAFERMRQAHGDRVRCRPGCDDCCHAVFGLFLIEAAYLKRQFDSLGRKERRAALVRGAKADRDLARMEDRLRESAGDKDTGPDSLARERIRCPLLNDGHECILYTHRPVTCRVYGIPTSIQGRSRVCGMSGFGDGGSYPAFDLDAAFRELFAMSRELLLSAGSDDTESASLLISVSKAVSTPLEDLARGNLGVP